MTTNSIRHIRRFGLGAFGVFLLIALSSCSSSSGNGYSSSGGSSMACTHWHNIMGDVRAGILTDAELRTKISEVRDSATTADVSAAATHLLSAATSRNKGGVVAAAGELEIACK